VSNLTKTRNFNLVTIPFGYGFANNCSGDPRGLVRFLPKILWLSNLLEVFSGLCVTLLYLEAQFTLLEIEVDSALSSFLFRSNPKVDLIEDFFENNVLLSGPLESSSRMKGKQSS
jgi:hypothetical protein